MCKQMSRARAAPPTPLRRPAPSTPPTHPDDDANESTADYYDRLGYHHHAERERQRERAESERRRAVLVMRFVPPPRLDDSGSDTEPDDGSAAPRVSAHARREARMSPRAFQRYREAEGLMAKARWRDILAERELNDIAASPSRRVIPMSPKRTAASAAKARWRRLLAEREIDDDASSPSRRVIPMSPKKTRGVKRKH